MSAKKPRPPESTVLLILTAAAGCGPRNQIRKIIEIAWMQGYRGGEIAGLRAALAPEKGRAK